MAFESQAAALFLLLVLSAPAAEEKGPAFAVRTAEGKTLKGPLCQLKESGETRIGDGEGTPVAGDNVLTVRRVGKALPESPAGEQLWLAGGDRIPVTDLKLVGEKLVFRHPDLDGGKDVEVSLGAVALVWLAAPDNADDPETLQRRLTTGKRPRDVVLLRNGDRVEGVLSALDARKVDLDADGKKSSIDRAQVAAVALSTELAESLRPKSRYWKAVLLPGDGSPGGRLSLKSATCDGKTFTGFTLFGAKLSVPLSRLAALDAIQGKAVYLSDLEPARYEHEPYLDARWPLGRDASVDGRDLRVGGGTHDKGLGTHSQSRISYKLDGKYLRFEALAGLDDRTGRRGSVRVRVLADGKPLDVGADRELTWRGGPLAVNVPVAGVKELTLGVDFGAGGDVEDHVNWVDALLVK